MKQDFRTGQLDILTAGEFAKEMHKHRESWFSQNERVRLAGLRAVKLPRVTVTAATASFTLFEIGGSAPIGPESGYIWLVRRVNIASNVANDSATFQLYSGSDNSAQTSYLIDQGPLVSSGGTPIYTSTALVPVTLGASTVTNFNANPYPVNVTVAGGTVTVISVNGQTTNLTSGTFTLSPGSNIALTYSVAPTTFTTAAVGSTFQVSGVTASTTKQGFQVGNAYYPGNKAWWVWPDEQVYATVQGATINSQYTLTGTALEVPAEMQGKLVG